MGPKRKAVKRSNAKAKSSPKPKQKKANTKAKEKKRSKSQEKKKHSRSQEKKRRSWSQEKKKRVQKSNKIAKQHKQKLLNAKKERQRHRNAQMMRMRRRVQGKAKPTERAPKEGEATKDAEELDAVETIMTNQYMKEDSFFMRMQMRLEDCLAGLLFFLTVTLRSERTFDWLVFLANNLGLYQEYEINDYGQRLSPRTGRPVLLSLGPVRVVQTVESANQVRSYWDPYIRDYLRNSNLTTDCWRANRMALQVALCMDDSGTMYDMPLNNGGDLEPEA